MFIKRASSLILNQIQSKPIASTSNLFRFTPTSTKTTTRFASSSSATSTSTNLTPLSRPPSKQHKPKKSKTPSSTTITTTTPLKLIDPIATTFPTLNLVSSKQSSKLNSDGKVRAITTAESYDIPALLKTMQNLSSAVNLMGEAIYLPKWSPVNSTEVGEVFIFESGSIVCWGLSSEGLENFLRTVIRGSSPNNTNFVEKNRYAESETEVLDYYVATDGVTKMEGDKIFLSAAPSASSNLNSSPDRNLLARLAFSAGLSRVTKLGVYEEKFDDFAEGIAGIPTLLEAGSESPVEKGIIIRRLGILHGFRNKLNLEDENLLDEPEFLWEDSKLHSYYTSICDALEFDSRIKTLNQRIEYGFHLQSTLMDILNTKTSHFLEWIIIVLIAFEITIVLLREGFALSHEADVKKKEAATLAVVE